MNIMKWFYTALAAVWVLLGAFALDDGRTQHALANAGFAVAFAILAVAWRSE